MYSSEEREKYFAQTIDHLQSLHFVEGIVQLGSGVTGYRDEYSDIDLIFSEEDMEKAKKSLHEVLMGYQPAYIKEKQ